MTSNPITALERLYCWLLDPCDRSHLKDVRLSAEIALEENGSVIVADVRRRRQKEGKHE